MFGISEPSTVGSTQIQSLIFALFPPKFLQNQEKLRALPLFPVEVHRGFGWDLKTLAVNRYVSFPGSHEIHGFMEGQFSNLGQTDPSTNSFRRLPEGFLDPSDPSNILLQQSSSPVRIPPRPGWPWSGIPHGSEHIWGQKVCKLHMLMIWMEYSCEICECRWDPPKSQLISSVSFQVCRAQSRTYRTYSCNISRTRQLADTSFDHELIQ